MTLHQAALIWLSEKLKGIINHADMPSQSKIRVIGCYPDIIVEKHKGTRAHTTELHEVEAVDMSKGRMENWSKIWKDKRTLWIVLPKDTSRAFDEIKIIEQSNEGFSPVKKGGAIRF